MKSRLIILTLAMAGGMAFAMAVECFFLVKDLGTAYTLTVFFLAVMWACLYLAGRLYRKAWREGSTLFTN